MLDLSEIPTADLQAKLGIMMCNRMIYSYPPVTEIRMDAAIAFIESELKARAMDAD